MKDHEFPLPCIVGDAAIALVLLDHSQPELVTVLVGPDVPLNDPINEVRRLLAIPNNRQLHVVYDWPLDLNVDHWYIDSVGSLHTSNIAIPIERKLRRIAPPQTINWTRYAALALKYPWDAIDTRPSEIIEAVTLSYPKDPELTELQSLEWFGDSVSVLLLTSALKIKVLRG